MHHIINFPPKDEFFLYLSEERAIQVDSSIRSIYHLIVHFFQDKPFIKENIRLFLNKLRTTHELTVHELKNSTINKYIRVIRLIAGYLGIHELESFKGYRLMENDIEPLGDLLSDKEMKDICHINIPRERMNRENNLRFRAALTLMRFSGMPPVDLCNLTWDMDKQTHFEYFRQKTGKHMIIPIVSEVRHLLDKMERRSHNYVFGSLHGRMKGQSLRDEMKERAAVLGIKKHVTPYSFRYSMITWCYVNGGEGMIPKIARISGHTVNTAMKHYVKFDVQVLVDALYATHPGLVKKAPIDVIKRTVVKLIDNLVDRNKYEIDLTISPKRPNIRTIHLS